MSIRESARVLCVCCDGWGYAVNRPEGSIKCGHCQQCKGLGDCVDIYFNGPKNLTSGVEKIVEAFEPLRGLRPDIEKHDEGMCEMLASNIRDKAAKVKAAFAALCAELEGEK